MFREVAGLLKRCDARSGKCVHAHALKRGLVSWQCVSKALLNAYAKAGLVQESWRLFAEIGMPSDPVVWNSLIGERDEAVRVLREMLRCGQAQPNPITLASVCSRVPHALLKCVHCYALKCGLDAHTLVGNAFVSAYADLADAFAAFVAIPAKDVVSWNAIIAAFRRNGFPDHALSLLLRMTRGPTPPNRVTVATVLPLCHTRRRLGKQLHAYLLHRPHISGDVFVCNSLLSFYLSLGNAAAAEHLFEGMSSSRDLVSWNALISGFASTGHWSRAVEAFRRLIEVGDPDSVSILSTLTACAHLGYLRCAHMIHAYALRRPALRHDTALGNAIVAFYAKCDDASSAYHAFCMMPRTDLISWNSMLDCFAAHAGTPSHFTNLLANMFLRGIWPDSVTLLIIARFCVRVCEVRKVKETHGYAIRGGGSSNGEPTVGNAILDAYAKCGDIDSACAVFRSLSGRSNLVTFNSMISGLVRSGSQEEARVLFKEMPERDLTSWNLMIRAHAEKGDAGQAVELLQELQGRGMRADAVTIMSLIPACVRTCSVQLARQCHAYAVRACFDDLRTRGALLDAYAKCGALSSARAIYASNAERDLVMSTAMIGGLGMHGRGEEALGMFRKVEERDEVIVTAVMAGCSHAGLVREGLEIFGAISEPTVEQRCCAVDLLARSGRVEEALRLASVKGGRSGSAWGALLGGCTTHANLDAGGVAGRQLAQMESGSGCVALANLYASQAHWDRSLHLRTMANWDRSHKRAACSWIQTDSTTAVFLASDSSHPARLAIYATLRTLHRQIKSERCV